MLTKKGTEILMNTLKRASLLFICIIVNASAGFSRDMIKNASIEAGFNRNYILRSQEEKLGLMDNPYNNIYNLRIGFQSTPKDSNYYDKIYNYPIVGLALSLTDNSSVRLKNNSYIGNIYSAYGFMDMSLIRTRKFRFEFIFQWGMAYNPTKFDAVNNAWNEYAGAPVQVNVAGGLGVKYMLTRNLEIGAAAEIRHYSNGRLGMPNRGINMAGINVSMRYLFRPDESIYSADNIKFKFTEKGFTYNLSFAGALQASMDQWEVYKGSRDNETGDENENGTIEIPDFKRSPVYAMYNTFLYRYSQMCASGIGLDFYYKPEINKSRVWDAMIYGFDAMKSHKYNKLCVGLSLNHEFFYHNFSGYVAVGMYMFRKYGIPKDYDSRFYQRAGIRYYIPKLNGLYIGYGIKAHNFGNAENMELSVGFNFKNKKKDASR